MESLNELLKDPRVRTALAVLAVALAVVASLWAIYLLWQPVGWVLSRLQQVILNLVVAFVIAYVLNGLVDFICRFKVPRGAAVTVVLIGTFLLVSLFITLVGWRFGQEAGRLAQAVREVTVWATSQESLDRWAEWIEERFAWLPVLSQPEGGVALPEEERPPRQFVKVLGQWLSEQLQNLPQFLQSIGGRLFSGTQSVVGGVLGFLSGSLQVVFITLMAIYFLADYHRIGRATLRLIPQRYQEKLGSFCKDLDQAVGGYLRGQVSIALIFGLLIGLGLFILGVDRTFALGALAGFANMIPYLGVLIGVVPALILSLEGTLISEPQSAFFLYHFPWNSLGVILLFILVNQIDAYFLSPNILAKAVNLHPLTILTAILIGLSFGVFGVFVTVPLAALLKVFVVKYYLTSRWYQEGKVKISLGSGRG